MPVGVTSMAFQMSTLACRIKIPISFGVLTHSRGINSGKVFGPISNLNLNRNVTVSNRVSKFLLNSSDRKQSWSVFTRRLNVDDPTLHFGVIESGRSAPKFSTSSVSFQTGIGWAPSRKKARSIRQGCCLLLGSLGLSTVVAFLHSTSLRAMATGSDPINLDSANTDWKEAKKFLLSAPLEERRASYRTTDFLALDQIPIWAPSGPPEGSNTLHPPNEALNPKISLFRGDITKLEIDGIVNAANKTLLGGGGVDGSIHRGAGPLLKKECATLGGCETGQAKISGAYGLPAKYVIHTVGPIVQGRVGQRERDGLRSCYRSCLDLAVKNHLRTVAFPCISTGVYGYPPDEAVEVALATVRQYLEEHHAQLDRVVFCVFLKSDEDLYQERLPLYFPRGHQMKSKL
ncbi:ADP-ribose glycohydrolase MACROD1 isoform X1 [Conger conger]|uniref:ADP-ribose glycohydrolase MACROD1 isoform X1 n=1 Tax=Conger conger TaxID=82655 RepID=UPI002A5AA6E0|nr:ADP-ribose glycohydrolase MACROD1 isoform X1 [Conger conger]